MIYDTKTWGIRIFTTSWIQYRHLAKYNSGYAYNMMFVGPGWLNKMGRWEAPYELLKSPMRTEWHITQVLSSRVSWSI